MDKFQDHLKRQGGDEGYLFDWIEIGPYQLSIQGSTGAYCSPREELSPDLYSEMEIAFFKNKEWLNVSKSSVIRGFPRFNELRERADGWFPNKGSCGGRVVFGYVPVDLIQDLYEYLKEKALR